jgi:hypothetical protein
MSLGATALHSDPTQAARAATTPWHELTRESGYPRIESGMPREVTLAAAKAAREARVAAREAARRRRARMRLVALAIVTLATAGGVDAFLAFAC